MACFLLITPLAAISGWLCLRGAQDHLQLKSRLEAVGLIALTIALFTIYILWTLVTNALLCLFSFHSDKRVDRVVSYVVVPGIFGSSIYLSCCPA